MTKRAETERAYDNLRQQVRWLANRTPPDEVTHVELVQLRTVLEAVNKAQAALPRRSPVVS